MYSIPNFKYIYSDKCQTRTDAISAQKGKPCKFPWIDHIGKTSHDGCANPDNVIHGAWCPTELNNLGEYTDGSNKRGYCDEHCPIASSMYHHTYIK